LISIIIIIVIHHWITMTSSYFSCIYEAVVFADL